MATLTELAFKDGDLVPIEVAPGVWDLLVVEDNEAIQQDAGLGLSLQRGQNQYDPTAGWNIFQFLKGTMEVSDIHQVCIEVRRLLENLDFVQSATCEFQGMSQVGAQTEFVFKAMATTQLGPVVLPFSIGRQVNV